MRIALYARVSTSRQAQAQTIEQQLDRLRAHLASQGAAVDEQNVFRDAGYSGASLSRPGLDQLRDRAALAEFERVVVTAPDRLARKYVHQVLLTLGTPSPWLHRRVCGAADESGSARPVVAPDPWGGRRVRAYTDL
jgi:predicted site-specific integrase-resolvase